MKKIMKKVLSLALVVALAIVPMTVMAATGSESDPIPVSATQTITSDGTGTPVYYIYNAPVKASYEVIVTGTTDSFGYLMLHPMFGRYVENYAYEGEFITYVEGTDEVVFNIFDYESQELTITINMIEGSEVTETGGDTLEDAINVTGQSSLSVPANSTKYFYVTGAYYYGSEYTLSVDGGMAAGMGNGITVASFMNGQQVATATDAAQASVLAIGMMANGGSVYFSVTNPSSYAYDTVYFSVVDGAPNAGGVGSENEPEELTLGGPVDKYLEDAEYYYTWTATETGKFTLTILNNLCADGWTYKATCGDIQKYFSTGWDESDKNVCEFYVEAEDTVVFGVSVPKYLEEYDVYDPYQFASGTVWFETAFAPGEVAPDDRDDGSDDGSGEDTATGVQINENYYYNYQELTVGTNEIMAQFGYPTTLYTFVPTESGEYLVTIDDQSALLGYYGSNEWFPFDYTETKTFELSLEAEEANAPMLIGVANALNAVITITRIGDLEEDGGYDNIVYENVVTPEDFTFAGNADELLDSYVDTLDDQVDSAVLGDDGYYHLNSADGPVLFVNLSDELMSLLNAQSYGQLTAVNYEEGVPVSITDFYNAFDEYVACADVESIEGATLYPLTEDLILMFKAIGEDKGWYGENGFVGGIKDDAWMFACYYDETITSLAPTTGDSTTDGTTGGSTTGTTSPSTGDNASVAVWAIVMVVAAGAAYVVAESKKRAR